MVDPVETKFRQVIVMDGNVFKLRESLVRSLVLTYFGNKVRVIVNCYESKNLKNKDNPQPSS
jgi:hypothetical protein